MKHNIKNHVPDARPYKISLAISMFYNSTLDYSSIICNKFFSKFKFFVFISLLILSFLSLSYQNANAIYTVNPADGTWVTSSPYTFTWNTASSPAPWWGAEYSPGYGYGSAEYLRTHITIYNNGLINDDTPVTGSSSYSSTLSESQLNQSYWKIKGYYRYVYWYQYALEHWDPYLEKETYWNWHHHKFLGFWIGGWSTRWVTKYNHYWTYPWTSEWRHSYTDYTANSNFGVDLNPPVITLTSPVANYDACNNDTVTFQFGCSDVASGLDTSSSKSYLEIRQGSPTGTIIKKFDVTSGSNSPAYQFTTTDTFYWRVIACDNVGRTSQSEQRKITVDITSPTAPALSSPLNNAWLTSSMVTFKWNPSTDSGTGVHHYYLKIQKPDGADFSDYGGTYGKNVTNVTQVSVTGFTETLTGNYTWWVYAGDDCSNVSAVSTGNGSFKIDLSAPQISVPNLNCTPDWYNEYNADKVNIGATFTDSPSGVKSDTIKIAATSYNTNRSHNYPTFPSSATFSEIFNCKAVGINGPWSATYQVYDQSGNQFTLQKDFQIDTIRPTPGQIKSIMNLDITSNPISKPYPIIKNMAPIIAWTQASDSHSGVSNYFITVWDSTGTAQFRSIPITLLYYDNMQLTTGLYYFEVGVTDKAKNGAIYNVNGVTIDNQTLYTSADMTYTNKRRFIVDLDAPIVTGNPALPKSGNGSDEWVVSSNPTYSGEMHDTFGVSRYQIRLFSKSGASYSPIANYDSPSSASAPLTSDNSTYVINPRVSVANIGDGIYGFEIQAWDNTHGGGSSTIAPSTYSSQKYDFKVDTKAPLAGSPIQPQNNDWIIKPAHNNPKRPLFIFNAANDNHGATGYSNIKEYMIRIWWDPSFPMTYAEKPFEGQPYKDYYIGNVTSWELPDDLKNGGYYYDIWVKDNANNWRWFNNSSSGNYTASAPYLNTAMPSSSSIYRFRVDSTPPTSNKLVSYIGGPWLSDSHPSFKWKAGDDATPGSGKNYYEMNLFMKGSSTAIVAAQINCSSAPGNTAFNGEITLAYGGGTVVSGAWPAMLGNDTLNCHYYWDVKLVDKAGNCKWYNSLRTSDTTEWSLGESFNVDIIPPVAGTINDPKANQWISQKGTRALDEATSTFIYTPIRTPVFKFSTARDDQSGLLKYIIVLKDVPATKPFRGYEELTPTTNPDLFNLSKTPPGTPIEYSPNWGNGTWDAYLKDGKYEWDVIAVDKTNVNSTYYSAPGYKLPYNSPAPDGAYGSNHNFEKFRLDTVPPIVSKPGIGELIEPKYGYVTTVSVNLVNFKFSKAIDDIATSFSGAKLASPEGPAEIYRYNFVMASSRDKLKVFEDVDMWQSGYTIDTTAVILNFNSNISDTVDALLSITPVSSVYWSVHAIDAAGNETQYADRKIRVRHLPPGAGNLEAPPNGTITTNRRPNFRWSK